MKDNSITIYGAEWCGFCHMVMRYLDDKKIGYKYIDIDKDSKAGQEAVEKSGQRGIPVTDMDGEIIVGFDRPKIDARLKSMQLVS
jgi:glutaredoxin 3